MSDLPGIYTGEGALAFFDQMVPAEQLGSNLRGNGVRLAVLGGCETGRREGVSVWSGIAPVLVKANIPAVVGNQYKISDKCAIAFSRQFYRALVGGLPIERAVERGPHCRLQRRQVWPRLGSARALPARGGWPALRRGRG